MESAEMIPRQSRVSQRQAGVTLLELLLVLALLATVIGVLVGPALIDKWHQAKVRTTEILVQDYASSAYVNWSLDSGKECPESISELSRYANAEPVDAWRNPLAQECANGGRLPGGTKYGVASSGRDEDWETEDDIRSWAMR